MLISYLSGRTEKCSYRNSEGSCLNSITVFSGNTALELQRGWIVNNRGYKVYMRYTRVYMRYKSVYMRYTRGIQGYRIYMMYIWGIYEVYKGIHEIYMG